MSQDAIANRLNELGVLSPFEYKISTGVIMKPGSDRKSRLFGVLLPYAEYWKMRFILETLCRETYDTKPSSEAVLRKAGR